MCLSCEKSFNQVVKIPTRAKQHTIERHYGYNGEEEIEEERSIFYENVISSQALFSRILNELRSGLQAAHIQTIHRQGRRIKRFVFYYRFDFVIGVYPNRQGGFCETDTIKIVCNITECQQCNRCWSSEVVTCFPCYNPFR